MTISRRHLRLLVAACADTGGAGDGFPDLVVGIVGHNLLMEVKDGTKPPSAQKLTAEQAIFHTTGADPIHVVDVSAAQRDRCGELGRDAD